MRVFPRRGRVGGLLRSKQLPRLARFFRAPGVQLVAVEVKHRDDEKHEERRGRQAAHRAERQRRPDLPLVRPGADEEERQHAEDRRRRGHEDRPDPVFCAPDYGLQKRQSLSPPQVDVVDEKDGVVDDLSLIHI